MSERQVKVQALRQVLAAELGDERANNFTDADLEVLLDARYTSAQVLQDGAKAGLLQHLRLPDGPKASLMAHFQGGAAAGGAGDTAVLTHLLQEVQLSRAEVTEQRAELKEVKEKLEPLHDDVKSWHSSQALEASKIRADEIYTLRRLLRVTFVPDPNTEVQAVLSEGAGDHDFEWDNTPEPAQRKAYMDTIIENLGHGALTNRSLTWTHQVKAKLVVKGLGHAVVARSDELICARTFRNDPSAGAAVGVELKKRLSWASRHQGEAEFYTFSLTSNFPFVQVVTDMQRGGFAFWKEMVQGGQQVVREQVLVGMAAVYDFLRSSINALPANLGQFEGANFVLPQQLDHPPRSKLLDPLAHGGVVQLHVEKGGVGNDGLDDLLPWYTRDQVHSFDLGHPRLHHDTLSYFS